MTAATNTLAPVEAARFRAVVDALDQAVAERPDVLASPVGFVLGALVSAANSDAPAAWAQIAGFADVLVYVTVHVRTGQGSPAAIVAALLPAG
jgi:hypothetical protein